MNMLGGIERAYFEERGRVPADQRAESFGAETITTTKIDNNGGEWTLQYRQPPIGEQPTEIVATTPTWSHEKNDFSNVFTLYLKRVPDSTSIMPSRQSPTGYWWTASSNGLVVTRYMISLILQNPSGQKTTYPLKSGPTKKP